jgi:hypothetical protein
MKLSRILFPFTHGIDMQAVEAAVGAAYNQQAILVLLSLIPLPPHQPSRGARLEHIQQSKDILKVVARVAKRYHVPLETQEVFTRDIVGCIAACMSTRQYDYVIIVLRGQKSVLMHTPDVRQLIKNCDMPFLFIHLPPKPTVRDVFSSLFSGKERQKLPRSILQMEQFMPREETERLTRTARNTS